MEITNTAAVSFIDAMGHHLPMKRAFSFKEVSDYCRREGITHLAGRDHFTADELLDVGRHIERITRGHVTVRAEARKTGVRTPLSLVDLTVEDRRIAKQRTEPKRAAKSSKIALYAQVVLTDGTRLDVVEANGTQYVGVDDRFTSRKFALGEVSSFINLDDQMTPDAPACRTCGEDGKIGAAKCDVCGSPYRLALAE